MSSFNFVFSEESMFVNFEETIVLSIGHLSQPWI